MWTSSGVFRTVTHQVNRLMMDSDATFDDLRRRFEALVPEIDMTALTALIDKGDLQEVVRYTAERAPHSFATFWTSDPTPMMQLAGHRPRVVTRPVNAPSTGRWIGLQQAVAV